MNGKASILLIVLALLVALVSASVFTVDEREFAIKLRFGEILSDEFEPGLHFKIPFVNNVVKYDDRILTRNNPTEEFLTQEKKNLQVDFYVKWRITDPGQYYQAVGGDELIATNRLIEIIKDGIRAEFAKRTVQQVVTADRREIMDDMMDTAGRTAGELGIEVVDVRVKRLDLPDEVSDSVFNRMRQERAQVAAQLRAEGEETAERIRSEADRDRTITLAEAYKQAEEIRGEGDAEAADIYATAHQRDPEFYSFYRSLQAYRRSLGAEGDIFVLGPDSEFFRYMKEAGPTAGE
ncbi:MAG: protease modulator HflC [Gammaproteobacteria bacterium]|jgi:membrane protease subunit HflC|nr:MAG: membrane protease HflC [Gammaproteobacteria bacterium SG8_31]